MITDKTKIVIVGKSSQLYQRIRPFNSHDVIELSTKEAQAKAPSFGHNSLFIIFSLFDTQELEDFIASISGKSITIGSVSALSRVAKRFRYSALKERQLQVILKLNNPKHKVVLFGDFKKQDFVGSYYYSCLGDFWPAINATLKIQAAYLVSGSLINNLTHMSKYFTLIDRNAAPLSTLVLKTLTKRTYGYIDAGNYKE